MEPLEAGFTSKKLSSSLTISIEIREYSIIHHVKHALRRLRNCAILYHGTFYKKLVT